MIIVKTVDFVGQFKLATSVAMNQTIQATIDENEERYLNWLLGVDMAALFIADCQAHGGVPSDANYLIIFNKFFIQNGAEIKESKGIKNMLVRFIYWHHVSENLQSFQSQSGTTLSEVDAAKSAGFYDGVRIAEKFFNQGLPSWESIQWYMNRNRANYPDFKQVNPVPSSKWAAVL